jgi:hypothetical protein
MGSPYLAGKDYGRMNITFQRTTLLVCVLAGTLALAAALSACGGAGGQEQAAGGQEQAKVRPLPKEPGTLSPGQYHSVKFKPSLSFKVGKGWSNSANEASDFIELGYEGETGVNYLTFGNVKEVYKPGTLEEVDAPKDLVGWLQHHPALKTSKPEPVTVGGVKGEQLDVLVKNVSKDYFLDGECPICLDIAPVKNENAPAILFEEGNKRKVFVLEDVKGETVMIWFAAPPEEFDEFAPEAQKVVDSVKWSGS